ncbi:glycosyl transferase family 1 [Paenibacillus baekrokdamisoli]|uniref:Glycosyl transferase family 1 n=1 Tax=Paenibacillus baekrokdamisoli TaxID=1712516 RepID=A0A3G9IU10_9BACL|nr:glycosyltransferase family 4 protein [Paenibacillus baekrokdamisoli]MBB3072588.1 glycosyltransferase involved in cell wall biosynthesis [Paenibacillus baekrokdamisoli]BBH22360.1 glycosyl transferase family 1 [Paenibacillus baekrokdamisoli]
MKQTNSNRNIVFLGTSLPRECGIATFTQDLIDQFEPIQGFNKPRIIAINNNENYPYQEQVIREIDQHTLSDYIDTANYLNFSNVDLLVIQHEFGIYGGESGEYLIPFVEKLNIPFIVIFHTVLTKPSAKQRHIMNLVAKLSVKVVTMALSTVKDLTSIYGIDSNKVAFIHHGVPDVKTASRAKLKEQYGFADRKILSTFGFLSPGKGIEYGIEAMRGVVKQHPDSLYIIFGKTHPVVKQETGEVYRQKLMDLVKEFDLSHNVLFVDKLLTQEEVIESLVMSDIYMTPYLGKDQAVSGTLAYGVGYGRVIVSTPYRYAEEMLAEDRGLLANFRDSASLEACILRLLDNPTLVKEMEDRTLELGRTMLWSEIAKTYAAIFQEKIMISEFAKDTAYDASFAKAKLLGV